MAAVLNKKANSKVMLVDNRSIDNFVNAKIITRYQFADDVIVFTKAKKALKYLQDFNTTGIGEIPFALFLDLDMPDIDGFDFLNAFSLLSEKIKKCMKIIVITNSYDHEAAERCCKNDYVAAFFQKPLIKCNLEALELLLPENFEAC